MREMRKRSKTLEEEKLQATGKDSLRPTEVDIVDANVHQLKARITELELQLDVTKAEGDAKRYELRGVSADKGDVHAAIKVALSFAISLLRNHENPVLQTASNQGFLGPCPDGA